MLSFTYKNVYANYKTCSSGRKCFVGFLIIQYNVIVGFDILKLVDEKSVEIQVVGGLSRASLVLGVENKKVVGILLAAR